MSADPATTSAATAVAAATNEKVWDPWVAYEEAQVRKHGGPPRSCRPVSEGYERMVPYMGCTHYELIQCVCSILTCVFLIVMVVYLMKINHTLKSTVN